MNKKSMINSGEIIIEPIRFMEIHELEIRRSINEHVLFEASGTVNEQDKDYYSHELSFGTELTVRQKVGNVLFKGLLTKVELTHQGGFYMLRIQGTSHTVLLDMAKKTRPFHNTEESYLELFQNVSNEYANVNVMVHDDYLAKKDQFFMQYQETDWEFMKRLASLKNQGIFADSTMGRPAFYIGTPKLHGDIKKTDGEYQIKKDLKAHRRERESLGTETMDSKYITYTVYMDEWLDLGQEITYRGLNLWVKSVRSILEHAVVVHYYELCVREGIKQEKKYNEELSGKSVIGIVSEVKRDCIKVKVQAEKNENTMAPECLDDMSCWFPYSTVYASKDGSGWYCMPEHGDKVRVLFPDSDEKNAYGSSSVSEYQPAGQGKDRMADYKKRYIRNPQGMEVDWTPEQINISANGASVATLDQNGVLTLSANSKIVLSSEGDIVIEAGERIKVNAADRIHMVCGGKGEITISKNGTIELKGNEIYTN